MLCHRAASWPLVLMLSMLVPESNAVGQQNNPPSRGPRFLLAAWSTGGELDASAAPVLRRRVSLEFSAGTIGEALRQITQQADLEISYSPRVVPLNRLVSIQARGITVAAALTEILLDVPVDVSVTEGGGLALVPRALVTRIPLDTGAVVGQVSDSVNGLPIGGATVSIDGGQHSVVSDPTGRYRVGGLAAGIHTVRARFIGYRPKRVRVTVLSGQDATVNISLARSAQELNQLVVTGTIVPTEVKALPTPVTVITEEDLEQQRPRTTGQLLRQVVPSALAWDNPANPQQTAYSLRGANALSAGFGTIKTYIDGVETANRTFAAIDPGSIERMEVIRGPEAATIYGSDANGGVIQIFTKRGSTARDRPRLDASLGFGLMESQYQGSGALRQQYSASVRGGDKGYTYSLGGGYTRAGDWMPEGSFAIPSLYGTVGTHQGPFTFDLSGRYYAQTTAGALDPGLVNTGYIFASKPYYRQYRNYQRTLGGRAAYTPTSWWRHNLTLGIDQFSVDANQNQPRLTTPADTLLFVYQNAESKTSVAYSTSISARLAPNLATIFVGGVDHYRYLVTGYFASGTPSATGTIGGSVSPSRTVVSNTGYFAQVQLDYRSALFVTAGLRIEDNSGFGATFGRPLSPRIGAAYAWDLGSATIKLRGAYGQATTAPRPGDRDRQQVSPNLVRLANPNLGPERQIGWDAGFDVVLGTRAQVSATYYHHIAKDLIQIVTLTSALPAEQQFQNVGRVRNEGFEFEGTLNLDLAELKGQVAVTGSRILALSPTYTGDLQVGSRPYLVPKYTGGASLSVFPLGGTSLTGGFTYVGERSYYDTYAQFACFGGTGPCQPSLRGYVITYPAFAKINLSVEQSLNALFSAFASVENLGNTTAYELGNAVAVTGRVTILGLRAQY